MQKRRFWLVQAAIALLCVGALLYLRLPPNPFGGCLLHDHLFLYCPFCGGTRAVSSLLRLDLLAALRYNAFAVLLVLSLVACECILWVRFLRGKDPFPKIPRFVWWIGACLLVAFFILRNVLLIAFGIDPVGDLGVFWEALYR